MLEASPLLLRALARPRLHLMTIKMGHVVCLILPKSLVCTQGLTQNAFLVRRGFSGQDQKLTKLGQANRLLHVGRTWESLLEP